MSDLRDFTGKNRVFTGTDSITVPSGTTAQRVDGTAKVRYNSTVGVLEYYDGNAWVLLDTDPTISGISPTNVTETGSTNVDIVITGTNYLSGMTVTFIPNSGSNFNASSVTLDSATQITATVARSSFDNASEPYDIKVTKQSGLNAQLDNQLNFNATPTWSTSAGNIAEVADGARSGFSVTVTASDADGNTITYSHVSGSLPSGASLNTSNGVISGNLSSVGSNTTSTFTIRASDGSNTVDREFNIVVKALQISTYTSGGFTFSVPSGVSAVRALVVAGGGGGGTTIGGGGGAGGMVTHATYPVSPGGNVGGNVGGGGPQGTGRGNPGEPGSNSSFGNMTAQGGGGGASWDQGPRSGGSGGGGARQGGGSGTQGPSGGGTGYGNSGGSGLGGGGGGAGGGGGPDGQRAGGNGRQDNITGTSVYYAGGGGGGQGHGTGPSTGGLGGGGQGRGGGQRGTDGTSNRGGGAGGGGHPPDSNGGTGGSGVVIVSH